MSGRFFSHNRRVVFAREARLPAVAQEAIQRAAERGGRDAGQDRDGGGSQ